MIRRTLLASTALLTLAAAPVHAQGIPVYDNANFLSQVKNLAEWVKQLQAMEQQYRQLVSTYEAIAHAPDGVTALSSALNVMGLRNPYPETAQVPDIANGTGFGSVSGLAQQFMALNRYHAPEGDDFAAQELVRRAQATAGVQGMALQAMQAVEKRAEDMGEFLAAIGDSPDIQQTAAIQARLQLEQNFIAGQQAQAQQLAVLQKAQDDVTQQRREEKNRQDYQEFIDQLGGSDAPAVVAGGN